MSADDEFERIAAELANAGVVAGAMFGKRALKSGARAFVCLKGDMLAVKLGAGTSAHEEALDLDGAELFDPSGSGRPFKDWVALPFAQCRVWPDYARRGLALVSRAPTTD
ncbi:MAG: hypothetical protein QM747_17630 [Nocardioides sp.]